MSNGWNPAQLMGMMRGMEKESLRIGPLGSAGQAATLALTPHPIALGSALTHPHITTDFCESQVELITGVHSHVQACIDELSVVQQFTLQSMGDESLWASSMPCELPPDEAIPLGYYGVSNVGISKTVYRRGLGNRYGRRMQTISGIHYNWSLPGLDDAAYFGLIRNFRRHAFLLMVLFGASPAVNASFLQGREHSLQPLSDDTFYLPYATSLRMGRLGYQSDAQSNLAVSYNSIEGYAASLHAALVAPYPAYASLGLKEADGTYRQLGTSLLQIENEFYGTIRPKRVIHQGERPLHALRERGVEYVEVRIMDLNPFEPLGIQASTMRFLDIFLLYCLQTPSPEDTPQELAEITLNQRNVAERGREPGFVLKRDGKEIPLAIGASSIMDSMRSIAPQVDAVLGGTNYAQSVEAAAHALTDMDSLPSAQVLKTMQTDYGNSFSRFVMAQSQRIKTQASLGRLPDAVVQSFEQQALDSWKAQRAIEAADTLPFDHYLTQYLAPSRLTPVHPNPTHSHPVGQSD